MGVKNWTDEIIPWKWKDSSVISPGTIAIDVPNYLTRRLAVIRGKSQSGRIPLMHVPLFINLIKATLSSNILPVFIFDGPPESRKRSPNPELIRHATDLFKIFQNEADPYNEMISSQLWKSPALRMYFAAEHLRELGRIIGLPSITAPTESEMLGAVLCREQLVDSVVSNDADALLFGSPHVTKQLQLSSKRILCVTLRDLEVHLQLDFEGLKDLAIICGCDFHRDGVKGIGPRRGAALLQKHGSLEELLKARGYSSLERLDFLRAREVFDEALYLSTSGLQLKLNPPLVPKILRALEIVMSNEYAEDITLKLTSLWRHFGNHQTSLEQWL
ncbi:hypothetical protein EU527_02530 [Candidatus Thorarchaeota archaeon]|nr:MAG: hypothetical protein EU527_02530 [Candidatus Thorarchaeota archaeon]